MTKRILRTLPAGGMYDDAQGADQALLRRGDEGLGGHVDALYEPMDILLSALAGPVTDGPPPDTQ
jgi:hypothetical protein